MTGTAAGRRGGVFWPRYRPGATAAYWASASSSPIARRAGAAAWATLIAGLLVGCGSSGSPTHGPVMHLTDRAGSNRQQTRPTSSATSQATSSSTPITTPQGYRYVVSVTTISAAASVSNYQDATNDAPPGEDFVIASLTVTNPLTDRSEPDITYTYNGDPNGFILAVPISTVDSLGPGNPCSTDSPSGICLLNDTQMGTETPSPPDPIDPQLGPARQSTVSVSYGPVPASVTSSRFSLYYDRYPYPPVALPAGQ